MAFFGKLKEAFSRGGIGVKLEVPKRFNWGEATIPATVTLTGHKEEPRTIETLTFTVLDAAENENDSAVNKQDGQIVRIEHTHPDRIELAPGQVMTLNVAVPAYVDASDIANSLEEASVPSFAQKAINIASKFGPKPDQVKTFIVVAAAQCDGIKNPKEARQRIHNDAARSLKFSARIGL